MATETGQMRSGEAGGCGGQAINLGQYERLGSMAAGGALLIGALNRMSLSTVALAAIGCGLLYRGVTGHCAAVQYLADQRPERAGGQGRFTGQRGGERSQGGQRDTGRESATQPKT